MDTSTFKNECSCKKKKQPIKFWKIEKDIHVLCTWVLCAYFVYITSLLIG